MWLLVVFIQVTFSQEIRLAFLTAVPRLENHTSTETTNTNMTRDYYFSCNAVGTFLQWEYNSEPLSGFRRNEIGGVLLDERTDYTYTASLLSSKPMDNNQAKMYSVLVMSFSNGTDPGRFRITCSSNLNIMSTHAGNLTHVKNSDENGEVRLDYVVSDNDVVNNQAITHIFLCGVRRTPQFIEVVGPVLGFSRHDDIGRARAVYLEDPNTADVQGILIASGASQAVTLIFVASYSDLVNVSCYDNFDSLMIQSREKDESGNDVENDKLVNSREETTNAILDITVNSAGSVAEHSTESITVSYTSDNGTSVKISWKLPIIIVMVALVVVVAIISVIEVLCFSAYRKYTKYTQKEVAIVSVVKYNRNAKENKNWLPSVISTSTPALNFMDTPAPLLKVFFSSPALSKTVDVSPPSPPLLSVVIHTSAPLLSAENYNSGVKSIGNSEGSEDSAFCDDDLSLKANTARKDSDRSDATSDSAFCDDKLLKMTPHERQSHPHKSLFGSSQEVTDLNGKTSASIPKNTLPKNTEKKDSGRTTDTSQEILQFHKHMLNLLRNKAKPPTKANTAETKVKNVMRHLMSQRFTPIFDSGNAFAVYIDGQQDKEANEALLTPMEKEGNDSENGVKLQDDAEERDGQNRLGNNNEENERVEDGANCGGVNDKSEQEFHHSASSASLAESDTTSIENSKVVYCFIVVQGLSMENEMTTSDDSEDHDFSSNTLQDHDVPFGNHTNEQNIFAFSAECDAPLDSMGSSNLRFEGSSKTEECNQAPWRRNCAIPGSAEVAVRRRLKNTQ